MPHINPFSGAHRGRGAGNRNPDRQRLPLPVLRMDTIDPPCRGPERFNKEEGHKAGGW